jgi:hypothetical protein
VTALQDGKTPAGSARRSSFFTPPDLGIQGLSAPVDSGTALDTRTVVVQHSVHIHRPIEAVSSALVTGPRNWFTRLEGTHRAVISPGVAGAKIRAKVAVDVGEPVTAGGRTELPITWQAAYIQKLLPLMTGTVELAPVDARVTRLTVCGMYEPLLGSLGRQFDDGLMRKVADATVKELAESIARRLEAARADG